MKNWNIFHEFQVETEKLNVEDILEALLVDRGLTIKEEQEKFLNPPDPISLTPADVGIDPEQLSTALKRIKQAIEQKESIVVYADYDADGITAGAIMWEALHGLGATVMPYIPHRAEEGYGLSVKGIDAVKEQFNPALIVTVDHGITAKEKVAYANSLGIEVIITDHHVKPESLPECTIVHTTSLCGAGVSWFVAKELLTSVIPANAGIQSSAPVTPAQAGISPLIHDLPSTINDLLSLATIGTIADLVPLVGPNRSVVKYGLAALNKTKRVGLLALMQDAGVTPGALSTYEISHVLAPRLNAMGRLVHALDALRLLCTKREDKAMLLARQLGLTNKERQQMTIDMATRAKQEVESRLAKQVSRKLLFVAHEAYNQGVIGLVAGKLVEEYYRPAIVLAVGETVSKASARSITGFNIIEAIRKTMDLLVDAGGHPMAAGFTVETKNLSLLQERLEELADELITDEMLVRILRVDGVIPLSAATQQLWEQLRTFEPFGFGNPEPVFVSKGVKVSDVRLIGTGNKHLKLRLSLATNSQLPATEAIAFNMGDLYGQLQSDKPIDIAYTIDMNEWNGRRNLQLKIRDIHFSE